MLIINFMLVNHKPNKQLSKGNIKPKKTLKTFFNNHENKIFLGTKLIQACFVMIKACFSS